MIRRQIYQRRRTARHKDIKDRTRRDDACDRLATNCFTAAGTRQIYHPRRRGAFSHLRTITVYDDDTRIQCVDCRRVAGTAADRKNGPRSASVHRRAARCRPVSDRAWRHRPAAPSLVNDQLYVCRCSVCCASWITRSREPAQCRTTPHHLFHIVESYSKYRKTERGKKTRKKRK